MRKPKPKPRVRALDDATAVPTTTIPTSDPARPDEVELQPVYRVVEYDPPEGGMTWVVAERKIIQVTRLKLRLNRPFPGSATHGLLFKSCIGHLFHLTATAALEHFQAASLRSLAHHSRMQDATRRALSWCDQEIEARRHAPASQKDGELFVILGARDSTDFDESTTDYAVCYLDDELSAARLVERMNELAHKLETVMPPTEEAEREMRALDRRWARGTEKPTQYRFERVLRGSIAP